MHSNGGLYEGADETSFRGAFLNDCQDVLNTALLKDAWNHKFPEQAVEYGKRLLEAADAAEARGKVPTPERTLLSRLGLATANIIATAVTNRVIDFIGTSSRVGSDSQPAW
jgi:hypothetical protein